MMSIQSSSHRRLGAIAIAGKYKNVQGGKNIVCVQFQLQMLVDHNMS